MTPSRSLSTPASPPGATVVVRHFDPDRPSRLAEISPACHWPVCAAVAGQVVEKNHVYVVQPGAEPAVQDGGLATVSRPEGRGARRPIDRFLADAEARRRPRARREALRNFRQAALSGRSVTSTDSALLREKARVPVTSFFHDPSSLEAVESVILPRLFERRPHDAPLRVWVAGCGTGEEAYAVAIASLEYFAKMGSRPPPITIFGTETNEQAIIQARQGRYPGGIAADVSPGRLAQFFVEDMGDYCIHPAVRSLCVFAAHDLFRDPPLSRVDIMSCRNLEVSGELDERVSCRLHYALSDPGFLLLGPAQDVGQFPGLVRIDGTPHVYTRSSSIPAHIEPWRSRRPTTPVPLPPRAVPQRSLRSAARRQADRLLAERFAPPGVLVSDDRSVLEFRGQTGRFLAPAEGTATLDLLRLAREELRWPLRRALDRARAEQTPARAAGVLLNEDGPGSSVDIEVVPLALPQGSPHFYAVSFRELGADPAHAVPSSVVNGGSSGEPARPEDVFSMRRRLESTIEQLEVSNEALHFANEEVNSGNEELRCANEELETTEDALSTTNEELRSVNQELFARNVELAKVNDDLTNVLVSSAIPLALLDRKGHIRRLTHSAVEAFGVRREDLGRPAEDTAIVKMLPALELQLMEVLEQLQPLTSTVANEAGRWFECTLRPYVTGERRIDGVVITANNVDAVRDAAQRLNDARRYAESIVDTIREALVVFGPGFEVRSVNAAFEGLFGINGAKVFGRRLDKLGIAALSQPALAATLQTLDCGQAVSGIRLEQADGELGRRLFEASARRISGTDLTLMTIDDVTSRELAQGAVRRTERGFRDMLLDAGEAVIMTEADQHPFFANRAALELFGYSETEILSCSLEHLLPDLHVVRDAAPRTGVHPDFVGRRKDGSEFPARVVVSQGLRDQRPATVVFVTDVTQERAAQRERQAYEDALQRMSFETVVAEERERRRLALALHDRVGQSLALARIKLGAASSNPEALRAAVNEGAKIIDEAIAATRTLTFDLSPPVLYDLGLKAGVSWLAEDFENRYGLRIEVDDDGADKPLDDAASGIVFRAIRELLMNVVKHAQAPQASVTLNREDDYLVVEVRDEGGGFDGGTATREGFGLLSVRQQVSRLGGLLEVESQAGRGTCARLRVSLADLDPSSARAGMDTP